MVDVPAPSIRAPILTSSVRQVHHLGLARGVAQHGFALGQHGGHHQVFGAGDGDAVEVHGARRAARRALPPRCSRAPGGCARPAAPGRQMCRLMGRAPMAQPPGRETRARPQRATSGPSTRLDARMVFTSS